MKCIIGTKEKMTQIFGEDGRVTPVTLVRARPVTVSQVKTDKTDGYAALQLSDGRVKREFRLPAQAGLSAKAGGEMDGVNRGDTVSVSAFGEGDKVTISGISKGKGFQGVVKRHGFKGGPRSHGQKHSERAPGSIGETAVQRVMKGVRMAGRMGSDRITVKGLRVIKIDSEKNELYISGAIPGRRGTVLEIRSMK